MRLHLLFPAAVLMAALPSQSLTLLEGASPGNLAVRVVAESNPDGAGTVLLQQIEILPIETTARTVAQPLRWDRSRAIERNGLPRVELPGGSRLFAYRRLGGAFWGFLLVLANGGAQSVLELPGLPGNASPFADRIGVAADGVHAVVPLANGDCSVLRLDGASFASTGTPARTVPMPGPIAPASLLVGRGYWFGATQAGRLLRCALADGNTPVDCTPPVPANAQLQPRMAMSGDGSAVAFLLGPPQLRSIFLLRETGAAALLPATPSNYRQPDYLPEGSGQPLLLLDDAATRLFCVDAQLHDESYLLDTSGALPTVHITDDPIFEPYIGIHILPAFAAGTLRIAIGDQNRLDWFAVALTANGLQVTNLTRTNPVTNPFFPGTIDPTQVVLAGGVLLATEHTATALQALRVIDPVAATTQVLLSDALAPPIAGSAFAGAPDLLVRTQSGDRLFAGSSGQLLASAPAGVTLSPPNHGPVFAATWIGIGGGFGIAAFYLPNGTVLACGIEQNVTQLVMTGSGGCFVNSPQPRYLGLGIYRTLRLPAAGLRLCISGAGG